MKNTTATPKQNLIDQLLSQSAIILSEDQLIRLQQYMDLIREWNPYVSLVSKPDIDNLYECHVIDALSLTPFVQQQDPLANLLDIGSGAGFPAIPLSIIFPTLSMTLIERSFKKIGFLRKVTGALKLNRIQLIHGEFPRDLPELNPIIITARAVERPELITPIILDYMRPEMTFLCQSGQIQAIDLELFHVERIEDEWQQNGLRRGTLHRITKR